MVERLKEAIERARNARGDIATPRSAEVRHAGVGPTPSLLAAERWAALEQVPLDVPKLRAARVVALDKLDRNHVPFDVLRARLVRICADKGWRRIGVTSPQAGVGKSVVAINLAFSLSRFQEGRTVLLDLDLKRPSLVKYLHMTAPVPVTDFLSGAVESEAFLRRVSPSLAVGVNSDIVVDSAELLQSPAAARALDRMSEALQPQFEIYDMPPALVNDDAMTLFPMLDAIILVAAAHKTTASAVEQCETLLEGSTNFLGLVLNKYDLATPGNDYYTEYGAPG